VAASQLASLIDLALADEGARVDLTEILPNLAGDLSARAGGQRRQFGQRLLGADLAGRGAKLDADQDRALRAMSGECF
jgi:hypothetical protein